MRQTPPVFKRLLAIFPMAALFFTACNPKMEADKNKAEAKSFGEKFEVAKPVSISEALSKYVDSNQQSNQVEGEISKVCQSEGCWFSFKSNKKDVMVWFDHKFTIDKDLAGGKAIANGNFYRDTTSVDELKEFAKDEGKSAEEIEKITAPEVKIKFKATGVVISK